ncbi:MAG: hypothetical protein AAGJ74_05570 [Pseudomonadota bacterium]
MRSTLLALIVLMGPAAAQDLRPGDTPFAPEDLAVALAGTTVEFFDGSKARYAGDGSYAYTYTDDGPVWSGRYETAPDSKVCVVFDNGFARCDTYVMAGERLTLIIDDGTRFPVRHHGATEGGGAQSR